MRADSKQDGIKREHVIFTQACLRSRQRMKYIYVSASAGQIWSCVYVCVCGAGVGGGGGGGGGGGLKAVYDPKKRKRRFFKS